MAAERITQLKGQLAANSQDTFGRIGGGARS